MLIISVRTTAYLFVQWFKHSDILYSVIISSFWCDGVIRHGNSTDRGCSSTTHLATWRQTTAITGLEMTTYTAWRGQNASCYGSNWHTGVGWTRRLNCVGSRLGQRVQITRCNITVTAWSVVSVNTELYYVQFEVTINALMTCTFNVYLSYASFDVNSKDARVVCSAAI